MKDYEYIFQIGGEKYILSFPDSSPITKMTFLPSQQPLISKEEHKFIYQPICKVACKTIKVWMLSLLKKDILDKMSVEDFGKNMEEQHYNDILDIHETVGYIYALIGIKDEEGNTIIRKENIKALDRDIFQTTDKINDYFTFTFVRNPWSRIVSSYLEKFRNPNGFTYERAISMNDAFKNTLPKKHLNKYFDKDGILSFEGFVDILYQQSKKSYNNFDIHWLPQYIMNDMYIKDFDFIGKLENFESDFDKILKELNIKIKPKYKIGSNSHNFWKTHKFYENNQDLIYKVSEIYKEDIARYDYKFTDLEK